MGLGNRLRERRDRVNLTQGEAARAVKVPRELVSMWETEVRTPNMGQLEELARLYRVNAAYLMGEEDLDEKLEREMLFRDLPGNPEVRLELERWLDFLDGWAELLEVSGDRLPGPGKPPRKFKDLGQVTDARRTPTLTADVRDEYGLGSGPIPDLYSFLDEWGILVYRAALGSINDGGVSGAFYNHPGLGYCILVNYDTTPGRQTFTLAHEFAHALFHYPSGGLVSWKGRRDPKERFADSFAAHFLVPAGQLKRLAGDEERRGGPDPYEALRLASYFRVSYATLLNRLLEERIIERQYYDRIKVHSPSRMAWYMGMDPDEFYIPEPRVLDMERYPVSVIERVRQAMEDGGISPSQAAGLLHVNLPGLQQKIKQLSNPPPAEDQEMQEFEELPF